MTENDNRNNREGKWKKQDLWLKTKMVTFFETVFC